MPGRGLKSSNKKPRLSAWKIASALVARVMLWPVLSRDFTPPNTLSMREIIHIQAGRLSNFIGTHYFNTLETYFASDDEIDHNVSFREGIASDGSETFCPRLLLFDFKDNFGALSNVSALYSDSLGDGGEAIAWYAIYGVVQAVVKLDSVHV